MYQPTDKVTPAASAGAGAFSVETTTQPQTLSFEEHLLKTIRRAIDVQDDDVLRRCAERLFERSAYCQDPRLFRAGLKITSFMIRQNKWELARKALKKAAYFSSQSETMLLFHDRVLRQSLDLGTQSLRAGSYHDARKAAQILLRSSFCDPILYHRALALNERAYGKATAADNLYEAFKATENALNVHFSDSVTSLYAYHMGRLLDMLDKTLTRGGNKLAEEMNSVLIRFASPSSPLTDYASAVEAFLIRGMRKGEKPFKRVMSIPENPSWVSAETYENMKNERRQIADFIHARDWAQAVPALRRANLTARTAHMFQFHNKDMRLAKEIAIGAFQDGALDLAHEALSLIMRAPQKRIDAHLDAVALDRRILETPDFTDPWKAFLAHYDAWIHHSQDAKTRDQHTEAVAQILFNAAAGKKLETEQLRDMAAFLCLSSYVDTPLYRYGKNMIGWLEKGRWGLTPPPPKRIGLTTAEAPSSAEVLSFYNDLEKLTQRLAPPPRSAPPRYRRKAKEQQREAAL